LTAFTRVLTPGGVLVLVIPQRRLAISARYLAAHYADFRAYRFPDPEFSAFRQLVLFATRRSTALVDKAAQDQLETWSSAELVALPTAVNQTPLPVPAVSGADVLFAPLAFDPAVAAAEACRSGVWAEPAFAEQVWPANNDVVRPLMPLRRGHLALL